MNQELFDATFDQVTKTQRRVLKFFLSGETDDAIATHLNLIDSSTVRRHIANLCRTFGLKNEEGEHYSYRQDLIELFVSFRPEMVSAQLLEGIKLALEFPEGQVPLQSSFYVERPPIEGSCYQEILQRGSLIVIKAPKLMGKTSLLARLMAKASQQGYQTVQLNLRVADQVMTQDLDRFLRGFCQMIGRELGIVDHIQEYWDLELLSSNYNCTAYFEECILPQVKSQLVLALDEVDRLFLYPEIARDFFGLLRLWHEKSKNPTVWQKLRLVVAHATDVYIRLDANQSPFNVGLPITLTEFTAAQVQALALRHQLSWTMVEVDALMAMVGGHPYLARLTMYQVKRQGISLNDLLGTAALDTGIYGDYLRRLMVQLQEDRALWETFQSIVNVAESEVERIHIYKLQALGLVRWVGNSVQLRCELYRQYFRS
jgi:serine/threonine-protein kinase